MAPSIGIYQPFYKPSLIERLDPGFIPLDWMSNPVPSLRELVLHRYIASNRIYAKHRLTGLLSPKFYSKTMLLAQDVRDWISDHPGHDVYLINSAPYLPYLHFNFVERGQVVHGPAFEASMRRCCADIGLELPQELPRQTHANLCGGNYWIASAAFWAAWMSDVVEPIFKFIEMHPEVDEAGKAASRYVASSPVARIVFIYERLVDHYVVQKKINAIYFPWGSAQRLPWESFHPALREHIEAVLPTVHRIDATGHWSESDRAWLRDGYKALNIANAALEVQVGDPADYDLPRFFPAAGKTSSKAPARESGPPSPRSG